MKLRKFIKTIQNVNYAQEFAEKVNKYIQNTSLESLYYDPESNQFYAKEYDFFINVESKVVIHNTKVSLVSLKTINSIALTCLKASEIIERESNKTGYLVSPETILESSVLTSKERKVLHILTFYIDAPMHLS